MLTGGTWLPVNLIAHCNLETKQLIDLGIWRERDDAKRGSVGPGHKEAMRATINMYTEWKLERLTLVIGDSIESWTIVNWEDR